MFSRCRCHHLWWVSSFPMPSIPSLHCSILVVRRTPRSSSEALPVLFVRYPQCCATATSSKYLYHGILLYPVDFHPKHDGEKDTQGPLNFSGNILAKMDDIGEGDDDDDDDDVPVRPKRRNDGKLKPPGDMSLDTSDVSPHSLPLLTLHSWHISA